MKKRIWYSLSLFGESSMGGQEMPDLTQQAAGEQEKEEHTPAAGEQTEETRKKAFKNLMEGEYKDLFQAFFQETFNRRFKEQKSMMEELERARSVIDAAAERYGTRDEAALMEAIRTEKENGASADMANGASVRDTEDAAREQSIDAAVKAAVEKAREETERAVMASIRARGMRPAESALTPGVGGLLGGNVSRLTRAERAEMARRAAKGERIEF